MLMNTPVRLAGPLTAVALAALTVTGCSADAGGGGSAQCVAPQLEVADGDLQAGGEVTIRGRYLFDECFDQGQAGNPPASQDVMLVLRQRGEAYELGSADAEGDGRASWSVTLPAGLREGAARLEAGVSETLRVQVTDDEIIDGDMGAAPAAVCEAPSLSLDGPRRLEPGQPVTVTGRAFLATCNDTGQGQPNRPRTDITLVLTQGGTEYELATADADSDLRVVFEATVPDAVDPGKAELSTDSVARLPVTIAAPG